MIELTCACGAVRLEIDREPREVTDCDCSLCRRYGVLWAYYSPKQVRGIGATEAYTRGARESEFHRCNNCGCVTHWAPIGTPRDRMGVNARLMAPEILSAAGVHHFDGANELK